MFVVRDEYVSCYIYEMQRFLVRYEYVSCTRLRGFLYEMYEIKLFVVRDVRD